MPEADSKLSYTSRQGTSRKLHQHAQLLLPSFCHVRSAHQFTGHPVHDILNGMDFLEVEPEHTSPQSTGALQPAQEPLCQTGLADARLSMYQDRRLLLAL